MRLAMMLGEREIVLEVEPEGDVWQVLLPDGTRRRITTRRLPDDLLEITEAQDGVVRTFRVPFARDGRGVRFAWDGNEYAFSPSLPGRAGAARKSASGVLVAPMVGMVTSVLVTEGQAVAAYQPLVGIEAMKVVTLLDAPFAGTVRKLHVQVGRQVEHGAVVIEIEPQENPQDKAS